MDLTVLDFSVFAQENVCYDNSFCEKLKGLKLSCIHQYLIFYIFEFSSVNECKQLSETQNILQ